MRKHSINYITKLIAESFTADPDNEAQLMALLRAKIKESILKLDVEDIHGKKTLNLDLPPEIVPIVQEKLKVAGQSAYDHNSKTSNRHYWDTDDFDEDLYDILVYGGAILYKIRGIGMVGNQVTVQIEVESLYK